MVWVSLRNSIPSENFFYSKETGCFIADASDIRGYNALDRVSDYSCDVGFMMKSKKTDKVVLFVLSEEVRDERENEIICWKFRCVNNGHENLTAEIVND